ncbi:hypothetical protein BDW75DRAFT_237479 [Aspergillus navahoensis]
MSLKLKLEGYDESSEIPSNQTYSDFTIFHILNNFLQPNSAKSLLGTVQSILALLPENAPLSTEVWSAENVVIEIAGQTPYSHPAQLQLAVLVEQLAKADKLYRGRTRRIRLPETQRSPARFIKWYVTHSGPNDEFLTEWPNLDALYAHLDARHIFNDHPTYMIWTMRSAFEENPEDDPDGDVDEELLRAWKAGPSYDRKVAFGLERWRFWKAGFWVAAGDEGLGEETRDVAGRAAGLMDGFGSV